MYNVYQHWDPLKVCIVGRSYSPQFYKFITNSRVRSVMERIAEETEQDYQQLIRLLDQFGVKVLRPNVSDDYKFYESNGKILPPPMTPRDYTIMLGHRFFFFPHYDPVRGIVEQWPHIRGESWPINPPVSSQEFHALPDSIKYELQQYFNVSANDIVELDYENNLVEFSGDYNNRYILEFTWGDITKHIMETNPIYNRVPRCFNNFSAAYGIRVGKDIYVGTTHKEYFEKEKLNPDQFKQILPEYRWHQVDTRGHADGCLCPVKPGLLVSLQEISTYEQTFPGWEVVYLPNQSWSKVGDFLTLKEKNRGKWWVPGEELNDDFTNFVESWLNHWMGYVEETVFDVNMLIIDQKNVVCNNYNKAVFDAFERHGITPHVVNFRHRYFWDGGLHCITSDIHRLGVMQDYFPDRN